jgi:hypothetical protein
VEELLHVYPLNDYREHEIDGIQCWCKPVIEDGVVKHNAMDMREHYETGMIKKH